MVFQYSHCQDTGTPGQNTDYAPIFMLFFFFCFFFFKSSITYPSLWTNELPGLAEDLTEVGIDLAIDKLVSIAWEVLQ